jgi:hypothetical protein
MFRVGLLYFRGISLNTIGDPESAGYDGNALKQELVIALENWRGRLAIAIAEEAKSTSWDRRRYYLDTADQMRRLILRLRNGGSDEGFELQECISALEALRKIPLKSGAQPLCKRLLGIAAVIE